MRKKTIKVCVIIAFISIMCVISSIAATTPSIKNLIGKSYKDLKDISLNQYFTDNLDDGDKGVMCVHEAAYDVENGGDYDLGLYLEDSYYYYDNIDINKDGKEPLKINYKRGNPSKDINTTSDGAAYLARLFFEGSQINDGWHLLQEYRFFCKISAYEDVRYWLKNTCKGTFHYFIHEQGYTNNGFEDIYGGTHYSTVAVNLYHKSDAYEKFIESLNGTYTVENLKYDNRSTAISNATEINNINDETWKISLEGPIYKGNTEYYSGVEYDYAFVESSSETPTWTSVTPSTSATKSGYRNISISGSTVDKKYLIIRCSYPVYQGFAMGFATWNGQERFLVSGDEVGLTSYVAYKIDNTPNVTITKKVDSVNGISVNADSANVEKGDTVIFKVTVKNAGATTKVNISDAIPAGLELKQVKAGSTWYNRTSWAGLSNQEIEKDETIVRYFKCIVANDASGTITNKATVTTANSKKLNSSGAKSLSDTASVKVLGYNYTINKTANKTTVEPGTTVTYTIKVSNTGSTTIKNIEVTDTMVGTGLENGTLTDSTGWNKNGTTYKYSGAIASGGSATFKVKYDVSSSIIESAGGSGTSSSVNISGSIVNNTAQVTKAENKNGVNITKSNIKASETVNIAGYDYEIYKYVYKIYRKGKTTPYYKNTSGKTNDVITVEQGDMVEYRVVLKNNSKDTKLYNVSITDTLGEGLTYSSHGETSVNNAWDFSTSVDKKQAYMKMKSGAYRGYNTKTFYIKAEVTKEHSLNTVVLTNTAKVTKITNNNGVDLINIEDKSDVTMLGYSASLNKYIIKHNSSNVPDRNSMTNEQKNNSPIIVKKGDTVTYRISLKNNASSKTTGETSLYNINLQDVTPEGMIFKSCSSDWTRKGDNYQNTNELKAGNTINLDITYEVIMSNIHLPNICNEVTYNGITNINGILLNSTVLQTGANQDYIRLDELDIAGNVWLDANNNGLIDTGETGMEGIKVILHNETDGTEISKLTDANGNYKFNKITEVQKGTDRDSSTGNYSSSSTHKRYYLEFEYSGVKYKSTVYSGTSNLDENANIKNANYVKDSNATEIESVRKEFNEKLSTITYNQSVKQDGSKGVDLSYEKADTISTLIDKNGSEVLNELKMSSYSFIDSSNENIESLWLFANKHTSNIQAPETDYLTNINLGLINKEVDLKLNSELTSFTQTINGQELKYSINQTGNDSLYTHQLYREDYEYKYDVVYEDPVKNIKGKESELNLEVEFKTTLTNSSDSKVDSVINEFVQYYDENFTINSAEMKIDTNNDGMFDNSNKIYNFTVTNGTKKESINTNYKQSTSDTSGYKKIYIDTNIKLAPGESVDIYTTYLVDKDAARTLKIDENLGVISEIVAYTTYYKGTTEYAGSVDKDSNPGNLGTNNTEEGKSIEDTNYYEDDTAKSEILFKVQIIPPVPDGDEYKTRQLTGIVWQDIEAGSISGIGDGILNSESGIENIQVDLYEIIKNGEEYYEVLMEDNTEYTNSDGIYTISDYKPGCYIVRFTYGKNMPASEDLVYNGQDYKSTVYKTGIENIFDGSTNNNLIELVKRESSTNNPQSDARDNELRRLKTMNYSLEMYNEKAEILKDTTYNSSCNPDDDTVDCLRDLYMYADTVNFIARVEYVENEIVEIEKAGTTWNTYEAGHTSKGTYAGDYYIENIDFGLIERPINEVRLDKYIKEIKLETSSGEILLDAIYNVDTDDLYNPDGTIKVLMDTNSIGINNLQQLDNTATEQGFRYINVDEELLQGAKISITYGFIATNNSEIDYVNENLYGNLGDPGILSGLTTQEVKTKMADAIKTITDSNYEKEIYEASYDYGKYIGKVHYTGSLDSSDKIATLKVDTILDYVDNSLVFSSADTQGKWGNITKRELIDNGYLQEDVYLLENPEDPTEKIELIADTEYIEFQTDTKNNLAVTIDDSTLNGNLSKHLYSTDHIDEYIKTCGDTELTVSTILSSENESDDMVYENIAEIVKYTTLTGRRTVSTGDCAQTVGNAKVNMVGYVNSDAVGTLGEPDTSIVEKVMLTPPTGYVGTVKYTKIIIYVVLSIVGVIAGIWFVPKLIVKIKNMKFIK